MQYTTKNPKISGLDAGVADANAKFVPLYQVWRGRNKFLFGGRLVFGPDVKSLYLAVFLIVGPVVLFCAFASQGILSEFRLGYIFVAIPAIFTIYVLLLLCLTSGRDPGIIPRNASPSDIEDGSEASTLSTDWGGSSTQSFRSFPATKDITVNGIVLKIKYCQTCMLYRPPRCSHCSVCNNCVERFDHHCPWVGQCIGKRNYRYFFMFVTSTTLLCIYVFTFCLINIMKIKGVYRSTLLKALLKSPISGILMLYTFVVVWFVGGLTAFHIYLISTNQTTYENFRYHYERRMNPYNRGCLRNLYEILLARIPESKHNFRALVPVDPSLPTSRSRSHSMSPVILKGNCDIEIGKRHDVMLDEYGDTKNRFGHMSSLSRCGTHPMDMDREGTPEPDVIDTGFRNGMKTGISGQEKYSRR